MLEKLVHGNGHLPPNQHFVTIIIPTGISYEMVTKDSLPGWDTKEPSKSRNFGEAWIREKRSVILITPCYVARIERNIVINPLHPEFDKIEHSLPEPVWWDDRLFG
jgi:RES domain-containing protein